jgi:hypothetical protein
MDANLKEAKHWFKQKDLRQTPNLGQQIITSSKGGSELSKKFHCIPSAKSLVPTPNILKIVCLPLFSTVHLPMEALIPKGSWPFFSKNTPKWSFKNFFVISNVGSCPRLLGEHVQKVLQKLTSRIVRL